MKDEGVLAATAWEIGLGPELTEPWNRLGFKVRCGTTDGVFTVVNVFATLEFFLNYD